MSVDLKKKNQELPSVKTVKVRPPPAASRAGLMKKPAAAAIACQISSLDLLKWAWLMSDCHSCRIAQFPVWTDEQTVLAGSLCTICLFSADSARTKRPGFLPHLQYIWRCSTTVPAWFSSVSIWMAPLLLTTSFFCASQAKFADLHSIFQLSPPPIYLFFPTPPNQLPVIIKLFIH